MGADCSIGSSSLKRTAIALRAALPAALPVPKSAVRLNAEWNRSGSAGSPAVRNSSVAPWENSLGPWQARPSWVPAPGKPESRVEHEISRALGILTDCCSPGGKLVWVRFADAARLLAWTVGKRRWPHLAGPRADSSQKSGGRMGPREPEVPVPSLRLEQTIQGRADGPGPLVNNSARAPKLLNWARPQTMGVKVPLGFATLGTVSQAGLDSPPGEARPAWFLLKCPVIWLAQPPRPGLGTKTSGAPEPSQHFQARHCHGRAQMAFQPSARQARRSRVLIGRVRTGNRSGTECSPYRPRERLSGRGSCHEEVVDGRARVRLPVAAAGRAGAPKFGREDQAP